MWSSDKLKERLNAVSSDAARYIKNVNEKKLTEAAVLVPIIIKNGIPFVLLTVRSENLKNYPGQVSLPGGKRDPKDCSLVATALRETLEEIGLPEDNLIVVGSTPPFTTRSKEMNFLVTPVVARVVDFENFHPKLNPLEVCETFIVPLENFIKKECHNSKNFVNEGKDTIVDYFEFSQEGSYHIIWGFTAIALTLVASLLFDCSAEFKYQDWLLNYGSNEQHKSYIYKKSRL